MNQIEMEYGDFQDKTSWYAHAGRGDAGELTYLTMGLMGEGGEFTDEVKKIVRDVGCDDTALFWRALDREGVRDKLLDELGDTFWYLNKLLRFFEVSQAQLMVRNTYKLYSRLELWPKMYLSSLEWPFTAESLSRESVSADYNLQADKDKDGV